MKNNMNNLMNEYNNLYKKLEKDGIIKLVVNADNRRMRDINLTKACEKLCVETVDNIITMEKDAFNKLSVDEALHFVSIYKKLVSNINNEANQLLKKESN